MRKLAVRLMGALAVCGLALAPWLPALAVNPLPGCCPDMPSAPCEGSALDAPLMACCKPAPVENQAPMSPAPLVQFATAPASPLCPAPPEACLRARSLSRTVPSARLQDLYTLHRSLLI